jgi:hypothetical protein
MPAMINGAHVIIYSSSPEADRDFLRDVLDLTHVDVGGGWLIFGLPPSEVAVHPSEQNDRHELYFMCDDVETFMGEMGKRNIACNPIEDQGWGLLTHVILPGGGKLGVYQPRHARPPTAAAARSGKPKKNAAAEPARKASKRPAKKAAKKVAKKPAKKKARR